MNAQDILALSDPLILFDQWYKEIQGHALLTEPTAVTLATASAAGAPSVRTVLLKEHSASKGFVFFTNYESRKGRDLLENPQAALLFYWGPLFRQVNITGAVAKVPRAESEAYWNSRPVESQLAGWISHQSQPLKGQKLAELYDSAQKEWQGKRIPCPVHWGGFALTPQTIEFWLGRPHRLHERVVFQKNKMSWQAEQLFP